MRDPRLIGFARENRQSLTDGERLLWYHLRHETLGVKFRRQHPIGPYVADFACLSPQLVVEIDGSQHWDSTSDKERDRYMRSRGWIVLRFWSWEIVGNTEGVLNGIADALEDHRLQRSPLSEGDLPSEERTRGLATTRSPPSSDLEGRTVPPLRRGTKEVRAKRGR